MTEAEEVELDARIALGLKAIETGDMSLLGPRMSALVEERLERLRAADPPPAPRVRVIRQTPRVAALIVSLLKAAGCRPGEWTKWLLEAEALDAADEARVAAPAPAPAAAPARRVPQLRLLPPPKP